MIAWSLPLPSQDERTAIEVESAAATIATPASQPVRSVLDRQLVDEEPPTFAEIQRRAGERMDEQDRQRDRTRRRTHQREQPWAFYGS